MAGRRGSVLWRRCYRSTGTDRAACICRGAGNSAGQAAVHLAQYARQITMIVRGSSLAASMSDYLIRDVQSADNIDVHLHTKVVDGHGAVRLEALVLQDAVSGTIETVSAAALFVLLGARPRTEWLPQTIRRDPRGFILTGQDLASKSDLHLQRPLLHWKPACPVCLQRAMCDLVRSNG
ncbi:MAG: FAD-dependent oxidoreductase [Anaerolineae bacterium]|nr:FAD-dependent oxidoreductase [Anaerolineae bacterium]